jgi:4-oxalmesaconate hydratase
MIIDCHGHYTTAPKALELFRKAQIAALTDPKAPARGIQISDDEVRETLVPAQLKLQQERGTDVAIFSPGAGKMAHHFVIRTDAKETSVAQLFHRTGFGRISPSVCRPH